MENDHVKDNCFKEPAAFVLKTGNKLLLEASERGLALPREMPGRVTPHGEVFRVELQGKVYIGQQIEDGSVSARDISDNEEAVNGYCFMGLKAAYNRLDACEYKAAGKLMELLHWDSLSRFCGHCGKPLARSTEISKKCPACGNEVFAPVSPAIIVLVTRGKEALMVHARNFKTPVYGLVAGFVETGESLEECVRREVMEETSLLVTNIRYAGSQPWPYPNSLMLGFTAEYVGGELCFADGELSAGGFFGADNLPPLPPPPSIARALIEAWLKRN